MSRLVYVQGDTLYVNKAAVPGYLHHKLDHLIEVLQHRYGDRPISPDSIREIERDIRRWLDVGHREYKRQTGEEARPSPSTTPENTQDADETTKPRRGRRKVA